MKNNPGQSANQNTIDPLIEALIKELIGGASYPKSSSRGEDKVTAALAEAYMASLKPSEQARMAPSSLEAVVLAEALAPALAEALAPVLAEELAPALVKAFASMSEMLEGQQRPNSISGSKRGSDKQNSE